MLGIMRRKAALVVCLLCMLFLCERSYSRQLPVRKGESIYVWLETEYGRGNPSEQDHSVERGYTSQQDKDHDHSVDRGSGRYYTNQKDKGGMLTPIIDEPAKVTNSEVKQDDTHLFPIFDGDRNNL